MCLFMYSSYYYYGVEKKDKQSSHFLRSIIFYLSTAAQLFFSFLILCA